MTDLQAKRRALRSLHRPYYARIVDCSNFEFNLYRISGENVLKFNVIEREWQPVRLQCAREDVRARAERLTLDEAARILGYQLL